MKKLITTTLLTALSIATSVPALARGTSYHQLLENQERRIEQGVESGALTRKESKLLRTEHGELKQLTKKLSHDGRLSKRDRRILDERFDAVSAEIWRLKHNGRYAYCERGDHDRGARVRLSDISW